MGFVVGVWGWGRGWAFGVGVVFFWLGFRVSIGVWGFGWGLGFVVGVEVLS